MKKLLNNTSFVKDYNKLEFVSLNPGKHFAKNSFEHTEMVVQRANHLAKLNHLSDQETVILINLSYVHDIGKITGTANPSASVELLERYDISEEQFVNLVKYHDINLQWYISTLKGETPSEKAWSKMLSKINLKILCIFMIADRIDCPNGWKSNNALIWFLEQVKKKHLLEKDIVVD